MLPYKRKPQLSPQEENILQLVAHGYTNKNIAQILGISPKTVDTHLRQAYRKLGVSCRAEAVAVYLQERRGRFLKDNS